MRTHLSISAPARRWKFLAAAASVGVVAAALTCPGAAAASTATAPPGTTGSGSPSAAVNLFAGEVETLGVEQYPATFAGATLEPTGVTDVYAVAASDAKLVSAVNALDTHGYPVTVVAVKRSYSQLMSITAKLLRAHSHLQAKGIDLAQFGPDPASGTVEVTLLKPTASGMSALASAQGAPVASSDYRAEASAVLKQQAGAGITLRSQYATGLPVLANRYDDKAAFAGGDRIYRDGVMCTSGFNLHGLGGVEYMLTAGHCGSGTWTTQAQTMGNTSNNYLTSTSGNDFQLTALAGGGTGSVWTTGGGGAPVTGAYFPAVGNPITFNGSVTGEVRGVTVQATGVSACFTDQLTGGTVCATHLIRANKNGAVVCQGGDSGGPVYEHTPSLNVLAVGIIEGTNGSTCWATQIDHIAYITGKSLITS